MSDDSREESMQQWDHEPLVHSNALMNAALHEVELVSEPGSVDGHVANSKDDTESARLLSGGGVSGAAGVGVVGTGSGSNGSLANGNVRKRV